MRVNIPGIENLHGSIIKDKFLEVDLDAAQGLINALGEGIRQICAAAPMVGGCNCKVPDPFPDDWEKCQVCSGIIMGAAKAALTKIVDEIEDLDSLVHDLKNAEASRINNKGKDAQIEYLISKVASEQIQNLIEEHYAVPT